MSSSATMGILLEGAIWALVFVVFFENGICRFVERRLRLLGFYDRLHKEKGMVRESLAEEVVMMSGFGAQHVFAGTLVLIGTLSGNLRLVRAGLLCEWGWESKDLLNLMTRTGAYSGSEVPEKVKASMRFHHLPGVLSAPPLILYGIHGNIHVQRIGVMMIYGGGIGILTNLVRLVVKHCVEGKADLAWKVGFVEVFFSFGFVRFLVFPVEVAGLLRDLYAIGLVPIALVVAAAFVMMCKFNIVIFQMKYNKLMAPDANPAQSAAIDAKPTQSALIAIDASVAPVPIDFKKVMHEGIRQMGVLRRQSSSVRIASGRRL